MKTAQLNFTASTPNGNKCEIRQSSDPYESGYSVFTWNDNGTNRGIIQWRESHELPWDTAFVIATSWVNAE